MVTTVVVGAGLLGASAALHLARHGARVHILERAVPGSGTTARSFARISAYRKLPYPYFALNHAGILEYDQLARRLGPGRPLARSFLMQCGSLVWSDDEGFSEHVNQLRGWGAAVTWCDPQRLDREFGGSIRFPAGAPTRAKVAHFPQEGWVDAPELVAQLLDAAQRRGATLRTGCSVEGVETRGPRIRVVLATGERLEANAMVNAAGPQADVVAGLVGRSLPLAPSRGLLVELSPSPGRALSLPHILDTPAASLRPAPSGRMQVRSDEVDAGLGTDDGSGIPQSLVDELARRAAALVPGFAGVSVADSRIGVRVMPADGYPSVGAVAEVPGYYEAVTHSGVTLGPLIGRLLAELILADRIDPLLEPYSPDRFPPRPALREPVTARSAEKVGDPADAGDRQL